MDRLSVSADICLQKIGHRNIGKIHYWCNTSQHSLNTSPPLSPDSSPPSSKQTQQINLVSYAKRRQSIVSESDLFSTPAGSVTSLNIQDDDSPKSKQSVHSNAFVETQV